MTATRSETAALCKTMRQRILIADDQKDVLDALQLLLKGQGYLLETVSTPADLLAALAQREFDLLLMDLNYARDTTSGREGLDVLGHLKKMADAPPIVAMTGWATVGLAVSAMQHGVRDFDKYRVDPSLELAPDFFVPDSFPPPPGVTLGARLR